jgi:hypothetical protein
MIRVRGPTSERSAEHADHRLRRSRSVTGRTKKLVQAREKFQVAPRETSGELGLFLDIDLPDVSRALIEVGGYSVPGRNGRHT